MRGEKQAGECACLVAAEHAEPSYRLRSQLGPFSAGQLFDTERNFAPEIHLLARSVKTVPKNEGR